MPLGNRNISFCRKQQPSIGDHQGQLPGVNARRSVYIYICIYIYIYIYLYICGHTGVQDVGSSWCFPFHTYQMKPQETTKYTFPQGKGKEKRESDAKLWIYVFPKRNDKEKCCLEPCSGYWLLLKGTIRKTCNLEPCLGIHFS